MPAVTPGSKVLLTGANGFIAVWILKYLLEKGYFVRGTVRSEQKGSHIKKLFSSYGDKLEVVVVPDITVEGAFDESVKGMDAVLHTSSPFHYNAVEPDELVKPAVHGTVGVLQSASKYAPTVKRVVVLSSNAAVTRGDETGRITEENWNTKNPEDIKVLGVKTPQGWKYRASKTLAERAAWEFVEANKGSINFDLVTLCPPYVYGPMLHDVSGTPSSLNESSKIWYEKVFAGQITEEEFLAPENRWIDVRDLATAHILSIENEKAGGNRFICSAGEYVWQDWLDVINNLSLPDGLSLHRAIPKGAPGTGKSVKYQLWLDNSKSKKELGLKYRSMEETTLDTLIDYKERGWITQ